MRCDYVVLSGIEKVVSTIDSIPKVEWDFEGIHYFDNGPLTVQYLFVLDALNFCFWPGTYALFVLLHILESTYMKLDTGHDTDTNTWTLLKF